MKLNSRTIILSFFLSFKVLTFIVLILFILGLGFGLESSVNKNSYQPEDKWLKTLNQIYQEVAELGSYGQDEFIKREFFMELDGNQKNKEEHVLIMEKKAGEKQEMLIKVTYFRAIRKGSPLKYADHVKEIVCYFSSENIEVAKCNYTQETFPSLLSKILKGIYQKKEYLKLIKK